MGHLIHLGLYDLASVSPFLIGWVTCRHVCESSAALASFWMGQMVAATAGANCSMLPASLPRTRSAYSPGLCLSRTRGAVTRTLTLPAPFCSRWSELSRWMYLQMHVFVGAIAENPRTCMCGPPYTTRDRHFPFWEKQIRLRWSPRPVRFGSQQTSLSLTPTSAGLMMPLAGS